MDNRTIEYLDIRTFSHLDIRTLGHFDRGWLEEGGDDVASSSLWLAVGGDDLKLGVYSISHYTFKGLLI